MSGSVSTKRKTPMSDGFYNLMMLFLGGIVLAFSFTAISRLGCGGKPRPRRKK
jgi:hypothetical protein